MQITSAHGERRKIIYHDDQYLWKEIRLWCRCLLPFRYLLKDRHDDYHLWWTHLHCNLQRRGGWEMGDLIWHVKFFPDSGQVCRKMPRHDQDLQMCSSQEAPVSRRKLEDSREIIFFTKTMATNMVKAIFPRLVNFGTLLHSSIEF